MASCWAESAARAKASRRGGSGRALLRRGLGVGEAGVPGLRGAEKFVEAAVQQAELELGKDLAREALVLFHGGFQLELRLLDDGINDVGLMAGGDFAAEKFPDAGEMLLSGHARDDGSAAGRKLIENGNVEVAIESERERARDGRGGEDEDMRSVAVGGGFCHPGLGREEPETMRAGK